MKCFDLRRGLVAHIGEALIDEPVCAMQELAEVVRGVGLPRRRVPKP